MNKSTQDIIVIVSTIIAFLIVITVAPLLTIAAINTLFATGIAYNFFTWLSMLWVQAVSFGGIMTVLKRIEKRL